MSNKYEILVIGDLFIDNIIDIGNVKYPANNDITVQLFGKVMRKLGGVGLSFAKNSITAGYKNVYFLTAVGEKTNVVSDEMQIHVIEQIEQLGIKLLLEYIPDEFMDQVYMINRNGNRDIVYADRSANRKLSFEIMKDKICNAINRISVLYISGYSLFEPEQRNEMKKIISYAKQNNIFIASELVPHDIFNTMTYKECIENFNYVDAIEISLTTMCKLLKIPCCEMHKGIDEFLKVFKLGMVYLDVVQIEGITYQIYILFDRVIRMKYYIPIRGLTGNADLLFAHVIATFLTDCNKICVEHQKEWIEKLNGYVEKVRVISETQ